MSDDKKVFITKRSGEVVDFDKSRIKNAIHRATLACGETKVDDEVLNSIVDDISTDVYSRFDEDFIPNVENIQDIVEKYLMRYQLFDIAKSYILYRAERQKNHEEERKKKSFLKKLTVKKRSGQTVLFSSSKIKKSIYRLCSNEDHSEKILEEVIKNVYDGISTSDIEKCLILSSSSLIETDPVFSKIAAKMYLQAIRKEVFGVSIDFKDLSKYYKDSFVNSIEIGVKNELFDKRLLEYDTTKLAEHLVVERDELFEYMGVQTLYERYLMKTREKRLELPQSFWMRVAMGLALNENDKETKAIEFYEILSSLKVVSSTPTLFHSGTPHPQLSSCFLLSCQDDLRDIFKYFGDHAQLSKWSGGIGTDWTNVRATGSWINTTKVESQGVIPFLKIANDTTAAINRSGKRRGAAVVYLETWHLDIEDFLDLRKNTGDERRRTHDLNTANWIPDLFMERVKEDGNWTLFSPDEVPDLHDLYGKAFKKRYEIYEKQAKAGKIEKFKVVEAKKLWRKMLTMLFETGNGWICFKDPSNIRSSQDHVGVVHSSNLCSEILILTNKEECAVCNLASINLASHFDANGKFDYELLSKSVTTAMRMLDNVIDLNFYPIKEAETSNLRHRPVGLGLMGLQDAFFKLDINFDSDEAVEFSDYLQEFVSYYAILASAELAREKGAYSTFKGSKWDRDLFPIDTLKTLEEERGYALKVNKKSQMDWSVARNHVKAHGMRNSLCMAIAPTATISNIVGCFPCIEPAYKNIYAKSNISGDFTVINHYLIDDLKKLGLWDKNMLDEIKYNDGSVQRIDRIPNNIKSKYKEAFEIEAEWVIKHAAVRSKWIDQSQSVNIFIRTVSGKRLHDIYMMAYEYGLKTTYYLRTLGASQIEKSTLDASKYGFTQIRSEEPTVKEEVKFCRLDDPTCESCQ